MYLQCRDKLTVRQQLIAVDVKVEKTFFTACHTDIKTNNCFGHGGQNDDARRASVLLCLESHHKQGKYKYDMNTVYRETLAVV